MATRPNVLRNVFSSVNKLLRAKRRVVGNDKFGNQYYEKVKPDGEVVKRFVPID